MDRVTTCKREGTMKKGSYKSLPTWAKVVVVLFVIQLVFNVWYYMKTGKIPNT